ncbi:phosphate acetyltransferase [Mangrovimonas sp. DI 80]|uniref:phosphate acetyltransferase n=1 Tax=Mangrovimonas sp. DI 80 TaxID=1779330 RepID=UPI000975DDB9|nr:phosphate acetyltransferase [Mangrovimonas sp. DI 80]OMP30190.1 phosphate acetyltransferase [Mangrovimonas sp. DI 80]
MNKGLYIATLETNSGKSIVSLGLMQALLGKTPKVAYFRPIISNQEEGVKDNHIDTILTYFNLDIPYEDAYALTRQEIIQNRNAGKIGESLDIIIKKYKELEDQYDFVLVEGSDFVGEGSVFEFDWNVNIAKNLGLPTVIVSSGVGKTLEKFIGSLEMAYKTFKSQDVEILALIANKIQPENTKLLQKSIKSFIPEEVEVLTIPLVDTLAFPTLTEITDALEGKVLFGAEHMGNQSGNFAVGAMQLRNFLTHIKEGSLLIMPGDRADLILGSLQAHLSSNYPNISGIVLTGGLMPEEPILKLIDGLSNVVPIVSVNKGTFEVTQRIGSIKSNIYAESKEKILTSIATFQKNVAIDDIFEKLTAFETKVMTPRMFQYKLIQKARKEKKCIVLPEATDSRILTAAARLSLLDLVDLVLLGNKKEIKTKIDELGLNMDASKIQIIEPAKYEKFEDYVETFYELRKHKKVNMDMARDMMCDLSYFGTMMIYKGDADGMVSGAIHTTQHTIRPALQFIKTKPGCSIVSSIFFMCLDDRVSIFGDCAINPNPNAEQLAEIAISSARSSEAFGIEPKVAMLSYSSGSSGKGEDVDVVREATQIVKQQCPDLKVEGPIQYDAAVDPVVGKSKMPDSEVAGQATVLIFPDLNTGNNTYKAVQRETGALAIGPMLQGLNKPVNDLSRGCTIDDVFNTVILTAIQAQGL